MRIYCMIARTALGLCPDVTSQNCQVAVGGGGGGGGGEATHAPLLRGGLFKVGNKFLSPSPCRPWLSICS